MSNSFWMEMNGVYVKFLIRKLPTTSRGNVNGSCSGSASRGK